VKASAKVAESLFRKAVGDGPQSVLCARPYGQAFGLSAEAETLYLKCSDAYLSMYATIDLDRAAAKLSAEPVDESPLNRAEISNTLIRWEQHWGSDMKLSFNRYSGHLEGYDTSRVSGIQTVCFSTACARHHHRDNFDRTNLGGSGARLCPARDGEICAVLEEFDSAGQPLCCPHSQRREAGRSAGAAPHQSNSSSSLRRQRARAHYAPDAPRMIEYPFVALQESASVQVFGRRHDGLTTR
jgi:hypothetical protein